MSVAAPWLRGQRSRLRTATSPLWWRDKTRWVIERPATVVVVLAVAGLLVRHAWISTQPLAAGDWAWRDRLRLGSFFPFPHIWDPSLGPGGANRFLAAFRFPVYAVGGLLGQMGFGWTFIEKALYFVPFAVLLPVAGWLLAREIMGKTRWTLVTPLLLLGNTYFLVEANGEIPLTLSEAIGIVALLGFLRTMRQRSLGWALLTGLLIALASTFDIRPAYLCVVLMGLYFAILALATFDWHILWRRALLGLTTLAVYVGSQAFWLVPLVTYHGNPGFPIPPTPDFPIITLSHGLSGVIALWTGGLPAVNVQAPLNPAFLILPLVALSPLLAQRLSPELLWLGLAALLFGFFANTDNPPLGGVFDWMYLHVPGWNLFREGSKFLFVVGIAFAILVPSAFRMAFEAAASWRQRWRRALMRWLATACVLSVAALSVWCLVVLESGALDSTTNPTAEPQSFTQLTTILAADSRAGTVLWFGSGETTEALRHHTFVLASPKHPEFNLTGTYNPANDVMHRDPFQLFCGNPQVPYCYLDKDLMTYLTRISGAAYVVAPAGQGVGALPHGITREWLQQQLTPIFGPPAALGSGNTKLLAWRLRDVSPAVTTSATVAFVEGGTWTASQALPALEALNVPAAYRQTLDTNHFPRGSSSLADRIGVLPRTDGGCTARDATRVALMAHTTAPSLGLSVGGAKTALSLLTTAHHLAGWAVYGPVDLSAGLTPIAADGTDVTLGPCVVWTPLAAAALGSPAATPVSVNVGSGGEQLTASVLQPGQRWAELHRFYDPGWLLGGHRGTGTGDGLLNLYHLSTTQAASPRLAFVYSTRTWEQVGLLLTGLVVLGATGVAAVTLRRRRALGTLAETPRPLVLAPSPAARWIAAVGAGVFGVAAVAVTAEWFGLPSLLPGTSFAGDPYGLDIGYGAFAIGLLLLSLGVRIVTHVIRRRSVEGDKAALHPLRAQAAATAALVVLALLLASCAQSPGDLQHVLEHARQSGALSPKTEGASLDEARQERAAHNAKLCIDDYTKAMKAFPNLGQVYSGRAGCYMSGGRDSAAAVHDYGVAISLAQTESGVYLLRAAADRASGNVPAALMDYQEAGLLPNATPNQQLTAIDGILALADYSHARALYQTVALRNTHSSALQLAAADIATATGDEVAAARAYAMARKLAANRFETGQALTRICHSEVLGHAYVKALADCRGAAISSPESSAAFDDLSAVQLALGNPASALGEIDAAIGAWTGDIGEFAQPAGVDGFGLARLYAARGWINLHLDHAGAAIADFELAQAALPTAAPDIRARLKAAITTAEADRDARSD